MVMGIMQPQLCALVLSFLGLEPVSVRSAFLALNLCFVCALGMEGQDAWVCALGMEGQDAWVMDSSARGWCALLGSQNAKPLHLPRIELGSGPWQGPMLPLYHKC